MCVTARVFGLLTLGGCSTCVLADVAGAEASPHSDNVVIVRHKEEGHDMVLSMGGEGENHGKSTSAHDGCLSG